MILNSFPYFFIAHSVKLVPLNSGSMVTITSDHFADIDGIQSSSATVNGVFASEAGFLTDPHAMIF